MSCSQWANVEFSYPADVTDVILLYQCLNGVEDTIQKVFYFCESRNLKKNKTYCVRSITDTPIVMAIQQTDVYH